MRIFSGGSIWDANWKLDAFFECLVFSFKDLSKACDLTVWHICLFDFIMPYLKELDDEWVRSDKCFFLIPYVGERLRNKLPVGL